MTPLPNLVAIQTWNLILKCFSLCHYGIIEHFKIFSPGADFCTGLSFLLGITYLPERFDCKNAILGYSAILLSTSYS